MNAKKCHSYVRKIVSSHLHKLRKANSPWQRINKIPVPKLRRTPNQKGRKMPQIRSTLQMSQMRVQRTIKRRTNMGSVLVTYKVFPEDIMPSFDDLKAKIKAVLPEFAQIEGYGEEPVAFGLVALLVQIKYPEDKSGIVDEFEEKLAKIPGVSQAQTFQVRRTSRD
jgi:translation elongation factor aEF-1 beta